MRRLLAFAAFLSLACPLSAARAQPVEVAPLAAPDAFSTGRDTGLGPDLWRGASVETVAAVLPLIATKPLSPAAQALARRVLAAGAPGPAGAGADPKLLAARANALLALGEVKAAAAAVGRAPGLDRDEPLARLAAETALLSGEDARACAVAEALTVGREAVYWLRLRAFCQAVGAHADQAQLTLDLAQSQQRDAVFGRLMAAKLSGTGPGAASLRNGLDYALSRTLGLDMAAAKPTPAVAAALRGGPTEPSWAVPEGTGEVLAAARMISQGQSAAGDVAGRLLDAALRGEASAPAALIVAADAGVEAPELRARLAALPAPEGKAPVGRSLALAAAGRGKLLGETAMLALWICADSGAGGPAAGDRARIIAALKDAGLAADAWNFTLEGLLAP